MANYGDAIVMTLLVWLGICILCCIVGHLYYHHYYEEQVPREEILRMEEQVPRQEEEQIEGKIPRQEEEQIEEKTSDGKRLVIIVEALSITQILRSI